MLMDTSKTNRIGNLWGSFTVEAETGLPILPDGQYWKLMRSSEHHFSLYILTDKTVETKSFFGKRKTKVIPTVIGRIVIDEYEFSPERVQLLACQLITSATPEHQAEMARFKKYNDEQIARSKPYFDKLAAEAKERLRLEDERKAAYKQKMLSE